MDDYSETWVSGSLLKDFRKTCKAMVDFKEVSEWK